MSNFSAMGRVPQDDDDWASGVFILNRQVLDYYDFVRAEMAGGTLAFDPLKEVADMVDSNCADLHYRVDAVDLAIRAGLNKLPEPDRLPLNIYGTEGDWETYSTPSRDARLKTAFKELRDTAERFVRMSRPPRSQARLIAAKISPPTCSRSTTAHAGQCSITYTRSDGSRITMSYEQARARLFDLSFDPYQCVERRWGATSGYGICACPDNTLKTAWYEAERNLRNQIDRTYEARMDFTLGNLKTPGPGQRCARRRPISTCGPICSIGCDGRANRQVASCWDARPQKNSRAEEGAAPFDDEDRGRLVAADVKRPQMRDHLAVGRDLSPWRKP